VHFVFHTEDQSGEKSMNIILPKILGDRATYKVHPYKGMGKLPKGLRPKTDANKRVLLDRLPKILQGHGRNPNCGIIVIICDLDTRNKEQFYNELNDVLNSCNPKPEAYFCLAVEEFEAWYLGDFPAIQKAYPNAKKDVLSKYVNDSICGTWEVLADAIYKGGSKALKDKGRQAIGEQKSIWAKEISPHMDISNNKSPSFVEMHSKLNEVMNSKT
jgi:hypothetical protein